MAVRAIVSKNPFTGQLRETFKFITNEELDHKLNRAEKAYEIQTKRTIL